MKNQFLYLQLLVNLLVFIYLDNKIICMWKHIVKSNLSQKSELYTHLGLIEGRK